MEREKAKVICMTPTKNEEWIIERFVNAASLWADVIIIADQMSTDRTAELAKKCSKVHLIENTSPVFNENERQKLLINEARKIPGKKLLFALDADEFLTGNFLDSAKWNELLYDAEGTVYNMEWPFIKDNFHQYWEAEEPYNKFAVMDDGSPHTGSAMHSVRVPFSPDAKEKYLKEIKVMHFQYTDWKRMESKHLWYQFYERVTHPQKSVLEIYRTYHHMYVRHRYWNIPAEWFRDYEKNGLELRDKPEMTNYWWDQEVERYIEEKGQDYFKYIDQKDSANFTLFYLRHTQWLYKGRYGKAFLRRLDKAAAKIGLGERKS